MLRKRERVKRFKSKEAGKMKNEGWGIEIKKPYF